MERISMAEEQKRVVAILTCFNRKEKTILCIESLVKGNRKISFTFVVVDDNSTDGTIDALNELTKVQNIDLQIITTEGDCFWAGGMRKGISYAKENLTADYCLFLNDDVSFYEHSIEGLIKESGQDVLVGATCNEEGKLSYSGIRYRGKGIKYDKVDITDETRICDTFNANCVLLPYDVFMQNDNIDSCYIHGLGDFDYGLMLKKNGHTIRCSSKYVGVCNNNSTAKTWQDATLSIGERIRKKEHPKGQPMKPWFHFLKKHFGLGAAIYYSVTPFVRIILKK